MMATAITLPSAALIELHDRLEAVQNALADAVATVGALIPEPELAPKLRGKRQPLTFTLPLIAASTPWQPRKSGRGRT